jgi:hypothetical protein
MSCQEFRVTKNGNGSPNLKRSLDGMRTALRASILCAIASLASADPTESVDATPFIATRDQLYAHLAAHPDSPIGALSPGARERFLISLHFNEKGLAGFDYNDIADELSDEQIRALLSSFGHQEYASVAKSRAQQVRSDERASKDNGISTRERQYNDFYLAKEIDDTVDTEMRKQRLGARFDAKLSALYSKGGLRLASGHELRLLQGAALEVAQTTHLPRHVAAFEHVFAERTRRKLVSSDDVRSLRNLYLTRHQFKEANALALAHPGAALPPLPQFEDPIGAAAGRATVWRMDEAGQRLTRAAVDLAPLQIIVAAACNKSKNAARDISRDELLGPVFAQHAQWLVLAPGQESIDAARDWNRELPHTPVAMIYDREEWSALPHWRMPTFFIMRDGKVIDSTIGWATGVAEYRDQLIATLRRSGLLPAL